MAETVIRPTGKLIKLGAIALGAAILGVNIAWWTVKAEDQPGWAPAILILALLWPAARWMRRSFTKAVISGDRLRYETGLTSKTTRTIQLSKIQDVRVDQSLVQRLLGVGDISIETAGETSRLTIGNVDGPQDTADSIMNAAHAAGASA